MRHEILFLAHRIPFPPDRGDKIRSHHIVKRLARLAPVHIATFAESDADMAEEVELAILAHSYHLARRSKQLAVAGIQSLVTGKSASAHAFWDEELASYVRRVIAERDVGTIFVFSGQMGQYIPNDFAGRVIVDLVDVDSAKLEAYADLADGFLAWMYRRESRLLRIEETRLAQLADHTLLISKAEAELLRSRLPAGPNFPDVRVLRNGTDGTAFDPAGAAPEPQLLNSGRPHLVFVGQMDYPPNVDAVVRATRRIMPLIRETLPMATFHVVGRRPTEVVSELDGLNGTKVWGAVGDVRPWLKAADIALVPLEIGRGVQNKVLEAMAMALPVVLSPAAATGIDARDGQHFVVAESDQELADAVAALSQHPERARAIGHAARQYLLDHMSWPSALNDLSSMLGLRRLPVADAA